MLGLWLVLSHLTAASKVGAPMKTLKVHAGDVVNLDVASSSGLTVGSDFPAHIYI